MQTRKKNLFPLSENVLQKVAETGIDRKALDAGINSMEFRYREADFSSYPKGLIYGLRYSWKLAV